MSRLAVIGLIAVLAAVAAPAAPAAWLPPQKLTGAAKPLTPVLVAAPNGRALAAWSLDRDLASFPIWTAARASGAVAFGPAERVAPGTAASAQYYTAAVSSDGTAALLWSQLPGGRPQMALRPAGGPFGPAVTATDGINQGGGVGFDLSGSTLFFVGADARGRWPAAGPLTPLTPVYRPPYLDLRAVGPNGDSLMAIPFGGDPTERLRLLVRTAAGVTGRSQQLAFYRCAPFYDEGFACPITGLLGGVDARGNALAVWSVVSTSGRGRTTIRWSFRRAGGRFSAPRTLATFPGTRGHLVGLAMNAAGDSVTWLAPTFSTVRPNWVPRAPSTFAVFRPAGGPFRAPQSVALDGMRSTFAIGPGGQVAGVGPRTDGTIVSTYRRRGSRFTTPARTPIVARPPSGIDNDLGTTISLAVDPLGNAIAVWPRSTGVFASFYRPPVAAVAHAPSRSTRR